MAEGMNTLSPHTMGDDQPRPAILVTHATFSVLLQTSGRSRSSLIPRAPGPRNCGQLSAAIKDETKSPHAPVATPRIRIVAIQRLRMPWLPMCVERLQTGMNRL